MPALPYLAVAFAAIGTGTSTYAAIKQGQTEKEQYDQQQKLFDMEADSQKKAAHDTLQAGATAAAEHLDKVRKMESEQATSMASAGLDTSTGTPLGILTETAGYGQLDALRIINNSQRKASGLLAGANMSDYEGQMMSWRGGMAEQSGEWNAAGSLLKGVGDIYGSYAANFRPGDGSPGKIPNPNGTGHSSQGLNGGILSW